MLNLPGMKLFDPRLPQVYRWNSMTNAIAPDANTYVDDTQTIDPNVHELRKTTHQIETMMGYLGL